MRKLRSSNGKELVQLHIVRGSKVKFLNPIHSHSKHDYYHYRIFHGLNIHFTENNMK